MSLNLYMQSIKIRIHFYFFQSLRTSQPSMKVKPNDEVRGLNANGAKVLPGMHGQGGGSIKVAVYLSGETSHRVRFKHYLGVN